MAAAQHILKEICDGSLQKDLLACRRSLNLIAGHVRNARRQSLIVELLDLGQDPLRRMSICTDLLTRWQFGKVQRLMRNVRAGARDVPCGGRRRDDLVKAIVDACSAEGPAMGKGTCPSAANSAEGLSMGTGTCPSSSVENHDHATRQGAESARSISSCRPMGEGTCPSSSLPMGTGACPSSSLPAPEVQVVTEMALVPLNTSADPAYLQRKLIKRWAKRWLKLLKKKTRRVDVHLALQESLVEHGDSEQVTVNDLRHIVGRKLGFVLKGRHRVAFDKALLRLTAKEPRAKRPRKRFKLAARSIRKRRGRRGR